MADVSYTFSSLSSTESNTANGPSGSTTIGTGLDENLRAYSAHIAAWRDQTGWGGINLTSVSGANTLTATVATAGSITFGPTSLTSGIRFLLTPASTNTGAVTLNITSPSGGSALGAKSVFANNATCVGGELQAAVPVAVQYDGTQFQILGSPPNFATQAQQEAGASLVTAVSPGRQQFHPSALKAWGLFDYNGGVTTAYNVTSIADGGTGITTATWTTAFSSGNYARGATTLHTASTSVTVDSSVAPSTSAARFNTFSTTSGALADALALHVWAAGDQ